MNKYVIQYQLIQFMIKGNLLYMLTSMLTIQIIYTLPLNQTGANKNISLNGQYISDLTQNLQNLCNFQITKQPAQKLALIILTHLRIANESNRTQAINYFQKGLQYYAEMECDAFDNIYFIWNNEESPEQLGVINNQQKWKNNVFFMSTIENSLQKRFLTPQWMEQQILFSLDDDQRFSCENIKKGLKQWDQKSYGSLGPVASRSQRIINYNIKTDSFSYGSIGKNVSFMNIVLTGYAIVPRHFMQLYYTQFYEIKKIREIVRELRNCEDISFTFITRFFYNEFQPMVFKNTLSRIARPPTALSRESDHRKKRNFCGSEFSKILGKASIQLIYTKDEYKQKQQRQHPLQNFKCLSHYKKYLLQKYYLNYKEFTLNINYVYAYYFDIQSKNKYQIAISQQNKYLNLTIEQKMNLIKQNKIDISYKSRSKQFKYFQELNQFKSKSKRLVRLNQNESLINPIENKVLEKNRLESEQKNEEQRIKQSYALLIQFNNNLKIIILILIIVLLLSILSVIKQQLIIRKMKKNIKIPQNQYQLSDIEKNSFKQGQNQSQRKL